MTAAMALMANGWEVSFPASVEVYDMVAREPTSGEYKRMQVKTIQRRSDRGNDLMIMAKKGNGTPYTPHDCDYIIGVEGNSVYLIPVTEKPQREYWAATEDIANRKWTRLEMNPVKIDVIPEITTKAEAI